MSRDRAMGVVLAGAMAAGVIGGCTSAKVSISPQMAFYHDKTAALIDVSEPRKGGLLWTVLLAGQINVDRQGQMAQSIERALMDLNLFHMVEGSVLERQMAEKGVRRLDFADTQSAVDLGRAVGVDGVVVVRSRAELTWIFPFSELNHRAMAKLVDVATGKVIWSADGSHDVVSVFPIPLSQATIDAACGRIASKMAGNLSREYRRKIR